MLKLSFGYAFGYALGYALKNETEQKGMR